MLQELEVQYDVRPWVIRQYWGQIVFIPAGCAHQVSPWPSFTCPVANHIQQVLNVQNTIKVACDFVSAQHLERVKQKIPEQRLHRIRSDGPEDVLQLRSLLWYSWQSISAVANVEGKVRHDTRLLRRCTYSTFLGRDCYRTVQSAARGCKLGWQAPSSSVEGEEEEDQAGGRGACCEGS